MQRSKNKDSPPSSFLLNNKEITNKQEISNEFNKFFSNVGKKLAEKIPKSNNTPQEFLNNMQKQITSLFLEPIVHEELLKEMGKLKKLCSWP